MPRLNPIAHTVHQIPVAYVVWICTVLAVACVVLLALRAAIRRLTTPGNRAGWRIFLSITAICLGLAALGFMDHGYRLHIGQAYASVTEVEYAQTLAAPASFPLTSYYTIHMSLAQSRQMQGSFPELRVPARWSDVRAQTGFAAPLVGLQSDLSPTFYPQRTPPRRFVDAVSGLQQAIDSLPPGHVYVSPAAASRFSIKPGDVLSIQIAGQYQYLTVAGEPKNAWLLGSQPMVIMGVKTVQQLFGLPDRFSHVVVFYTSRSTVQTAQTRRAIVTASSVVPGSKLQAVLGRAESQVRQAAGAIDATRRLAAGALGLVVLASLVLLVHGRRGVTGGDTSRTEIRGAVRDR
jgi:hypothetical protein